MFSKINFYWHIKQAHGDPVSPSLHCLCYTPMNDWYLNQFDRDTTLFKIDYTIWFYLIILNIIMYIDCRVLRQRFTVYFWIFLYVGFMHRCNFFFSFKRLIEILGHRTYAIRDIIGREMFSFGKVYIKCSFHVIKTEYDDCRQHDVL